MPEPITITTTEAPKTRRAAKPFDVERTLRALIRAGFSVAVVRLLENGEVVFEREGVAGAAESGRIISDADAAFQSWQGGVHAIAA